MKLLSPSAINLYNQCPRKFYYRYILKLKTLPSIHLIRGSITHKVLEKFFDQKPSDFSHLIPMVLALLKKYWKKDEFKDLDLTSNELKYYYDETQFMLLNWLNQFTEKLRIVFSEIGDFVTSFEILKPEVEKHYVSQKHAVQGFIDAIEEMDGKVRLMDYKTSKKDIMTQEYKLQLAIYAMLYEELHGKKPDQVGIYFLKARENILDVDEDLINMAKEEVKRVHALIKSTDIKDYPKHVTPLCKWRTGQCDYYDTCFKESN